MAKSSPTVEPKASFSYLVKPGDRPPDVVAFEGQMVDFFVSAADLLGVPKSVAAIYGIVFASAQALSFAEIENRLSISKGSISQGIRMLREVGALKEVSSENDRVECFEPDLELRKLIMTFIETRLKKQLDVGTGKVNSLRKLIPTSRGNVAQILRARLKSVEDWQLKANTMLPVIKAFLKIGT